MISLLTSLIISLMPAYTTNYSWMTPEIYQYTEKYAEMYNLDPALVRSVINAESTGRQYAVSKSGAIGLMQIMPFHVKNPKKLFNIEYNIKKGCQILSYYKRFAYGNIILALKFYNAGPRGKTFPVKYIAKIINHLHNEV